MRPNIARWLRNTIGLPECAGPLDFREQHYRLEKEFLAMADTEECLLGAHASQSASQSQLAK